MKTILLLLFGLIFILSCNQTKNISTEEITKIETDINNLLDNWHIAAAEADFDNYFSLMDSVSYFIGTDASEHWTKQEFIEFSKPYFDKGKAWDFKPIERNIFVGKSAEIVWFDELLDTWMGVCRGSGVMAKSNGKWKLQHYVLSMTIANEDINAVLEVKNKVLLRINKN